jgi:serine phosphatase RsbU (regulator of sigma subunit)
VVLLVGLFLLLRVTAQPGLGVALWGVVPIVLATFWFSLPGGLLTAAAALAAFLVDEHLTPSDAFSQASLALGTLNRAVVFFGVPVLLAVLLQRERRLVRRLEQQRVELAELQSLRAALTPSAVPSVSGLEIATAFVPAEGEVAGDFFLVVQGPGGSTTVVVGDVVGHGLEAARSATFVRASLATFARFTSDAAELLRLADTALAERGPATSEFVTAVAVTVAADGEVCWATAGHPVPWYLDTAASPVAGRAGHPLGVGLGQPGLQVGRAPLGTGLLLFTDGLPEARTARRSPGTVLELFGEDRARQVVREQRDASPEDVVAALVSAVTTFAGDELADDLCLVAVRPRS